MKRNFWLSLAILTLMAAGMFGCGGIVNNPTPSITSLSPPSITAGGPGFTLTVTGSGFAPQSSIFFNGSARITMFLTDNTLCTMILPGDIATPGPISVFVQTPQPGGGTTATLTFTVNPQTSAVPQVTSVSPTTGFAGINGLTVVVTGANFTAQSVVTVNNGNRPTSFTNSSQISASLLSTDFTAAGTLQIGVLNPPPGGGASNTITFAITNPPPAITIIAPATTAVNGTTAVSLSVSGSGFDQASIIQYNGMPLATTFVANNQLSTSVPTTPQLTFAGTVPITVINPAPGGGTSNPVAFTVLPSSTGAGLPELVDIAQTGAQANSGIGNDAVSGPVISANGAFVAFASVSSNLVSNDTNGVADIFLRNTCLGGVATCTPATTLVSAATSGAQSNAASAEPSIDSTGRFVTFTSTATTLVPGILTGSRQVYFRDTCSTLTSGCTVATTLVSVAPDGVTPANNDSFASSISPDGRYVAFVSAATNLGPANPDGFQEVFLRDTCTGVASGCTPTTFLVSVASDGVSAADGASAAPSVATNGLFVAFSSTSTTLGPANPAGTQEIFERGTCVNVASGCTTSTTLISTPDGTTAADGASITPTVTTDGRFVAFASTATILSGASTAGIQQIFLRDTCTGVASGCTPATSLISLASDGISSGNGLSERPSISTNGQVIGFASLASNLVASDTNDVEDVFARNTCAGVTASCTPSTAIVSVAAPAGTPPVSAQGNNISFAPAVSNNVHFIAFISFANNLVPSDINGLDDVFLAVTTF